MRIGCVAGKFWPPHRGHQYLIETALAQCDRLHIIVVEQPEERPPGALRARWMGYLFPGTKVHLTTDDIPDTSAAWAARTRELLGASPDVVFTSEPYGDTWAAELGCEHASVDPQRTVVRTSGTAVRADPIGHWKALSPDARAYYAPRVVIVGAESTGKSMLAERLAKRFLTVWSAEYARLYGEDKQFGPDDWERDEKLFDEILAGQPGGEMFMALRCNRLLICDTDLLVTSIWHETYRPDAVEERARILAKYEAQRGTYATALYLLSGHDAPWIQDGTRNRGSDDAALVGSRPWFTQRLREELAARGEDVVELSGSWDDRFEQAVDAIVERGFAKRELDKSRATPEQIRERLGELTPDLDPLGEGWPEHPVERHRLIRAMAIRGGREVPPEEPSTEEGLRDESGMWMAWLDRRAQRGRRDDAAAE